MHIYNVAARSNFGIAVQEGSDLQNIEDLRGKVVGTATADGAEVGFARKVLIGAGTTEGKDFEFLTVGDGGLATAAFLNGEFNAHSASTADTAVLNQRGMTGFGTESKVALAAFIARFPIVVGTVAGLHAADENARMGYRWPSVFWPAF